MRRTALTPKQRLRVIAVAVSLAALAFSSAGAPALAAARYPASVRHAFVGACTRTAVSVTNGKVSKARATLYCTRALSCISKKLTLKQFEQVVINMQTGAPNPKARVLTTCERSAAKSLG